LLAGGFGAWLRTVADDIPDIESVAKAVSDALICNKISAALEDAIDEPEAFKVWTSS